MEGVLAGVIQSVLHQDIRQKEKTEPENKLFSEIEYVKRALDNASSRFENENDPDLVECYIYEMQSLSARYRFLLREARRQKLNNSMLATLTLSR